MPFTKAYYFNPDQIDTVAELEKIAKAKGLPEIRGNAVQDIYRIYKNMKKTNFFHDLFGKFGNTEVKNWKIAYTSDVFDAYLWEGEIFLSSRYPTRRSCRSLTMASRSLR